VKSLVKSLANVSVKPDYFRSTSLDFLIPLTPLTVPRTKTKPKVSERESGEQTLIDPSWAWLRYEMDPDGPSGHSVDGTPH